MKKQLLFMLLLLLGVVQAVVAQEKEAYAVLSEDSKTVTFYYDTQKANRTEVVEINKSVISDGQSNAYGTATTAVIDPSFAEYRPTSTAYWFMWCSKLTSITGMEYLNTANVTDMSYMFYRCGSLKSLNLSNFNTSKVTDMSYMFYYCWSQYLKTLDLSNFNTSNVTNMEYMFYYCRYLSALDISNFNTSNVTNMFAMFSNCFQLTTIYAGKDWTTETVTKSTDMFKDCTDLVGGAGTAYEYKHKDAAYARIDGGTDSPGYFSDKNHSVAYTVLSEDGKTVTFYYDSKKANRTGVREINRTRKDAYIGMNNAYGTATTAIIDASFADYHPQSTAYWFTECEKLTSITGMEYLNTSNVTNMRNMFSGSKSLTSLDLSNFNTDKVTNMNGMFDDCESLTSLDLSNFNTDKVAIMSSMFSKCYSLTSLDLSNFNSSNVTDMSWMFSGCRSLTSLDLSNFNTSNVTMMGEMFYFCRSLTSLNLSNFNTSNVTTMGGMFTDCSSLETIYAGENWTTDAITNNGRMFYNCTALVGGEGTSYDASHTNVEYARIDGGADAPGYLTNINKTGITIILKVSDDNGHDVLENVSIVWFDGEGRQIGTGNTLSGVGEDPEIYYSVLLDETLGRVCREVNMQKAEINDEGEVTCQLKNIGRVTLEGRVSATDIDKTTATVSVRQMLNGKWQQDYSTQTDAQGRFSIEVYDDTTDVVISGDGYLDVSLHRNGFNDDSNMGTIPMSLLTGFAVTANVTMKETVASGEIAEVNVWSGNMNDIEFSLTNTTKGAAIEDIAVQNGNVIIKSGAKVGDEISLTAKSKQRVFADATTTFVLSDGANSFDLQLTELGGMEATCAATNNGTTVGYLYDSNGSLAARGSYKGETLSLRHLANGNYTLISMGQSLLLGSMTKLSDISEVGLSEGTDYVTSTIYVTDGTLTTASVSTVPKMNDARFYHTTDNTYFSANKSMVTVGNYISMSAHVDFKAEYADKIDDVTLTIELPEGCQMLENTVIANRQSVPYTLNGNTITIPLTKEQYESSVRFCIVPTLNQDYTITAMASFNLDGQRQQPIGTAQLEGKGLSLSAPLMTASPTVTFTGTAKGRSEVSIYDNDVLIGTTISKADGSWSAECELFKPFNPSFHDIYAKITAENGMELTSETQQVEYIKTSIVPQKVTMLYYNPEFSKNYNIVFDLVNGTTTPSNYYYFPYKNWPNWYQTRETEPKAFTFLADFTLNDPSRVKKVNIKVLNSDGTLRTLPATFDEKQGKWVATTRYSSARRLPQNVTVDYSLVPGLEDDTQREDIFKEQASSLVSTAYAIKDLYDDKVQMTPIEEDEEHALFELRTEENQEPLYFKITTMDYAEMEKMMSTNQFVYMKQEGEVIGTYTESTENGHTVYAVNVADSTSFKLELWNPSAPSGAKANLSRLSSSVTASITALKASVSNATFLNKALGALGHLGDAVDAFTNIREYWSVRGDFENMCNRILMYSEILQKENENTFKAITSKCPDGSYRLSRDDMSHYYDELKDIADDESAFSQQYYKYLDEYKSKLCASVVTYCVTLGVGRALGALENLSLFRRANGAVNRLFNRYFTSCVSTETTAGILSSVVGTVAGNIIDAGIEQAGKIFDYQDFNAVRDRTLSWASKEYESLANRYIDLQFTMKEDYKMCYDEDDKDEEKKDEPYDEKSEYKPEFKCKGTTPIHDPSGYVYEAVLSNRLPGVTTTVYEQVNGAAVKWNAEEYSQENPLLTDETGFYRWDVPQGMWQVKYEKEGYETTYSEWLPVPPPQLDVNICMKQSTPPTVKQMRGYETGITVEMAKYMMPETMTAQNITVTRNGEVESGSIEMINAEKAPLGEETYVSKVRFVPESNFNPSDVVVVTIHKEVESYCGAQMTADHVETVKIESEVKGIVVDESITIPYQGERELRIVVLPKEASAGKKLRVSTSSQMIASLNSSEAVIDEDGAVNLTIGGELPGGAVLDFAVEGTDVTATTKAQVVVGGDIVETPTASISSGETIISGTKLTLSCTTSGATIYYTLDGSCPCDEASRMLYNGPIAITKDVTVKVMAVKDGMDDSDVATFVYTVQYEQVETPQASIASTETVMSGQTLELTCATNGATIYYTLDGSSPTDESARMKYSSPIVLTEDVTVKAIAVKDGMDNSDVATFVYTVTGIKGVVTDGKEEDTPIYNVSGQRLNKTRMGINIIGRKKVMMK